MKQYDFRFDETLIRSFIGRILTKYEHAECIHTNSVTGILGFKIDAQVFELTNEYEGIDFFTLDNEATIFRISKSEWNRIETSINKEINETDVNEKITKVVLVNDHTTLHINQNAEYDMWDTKAIIFYFENFEICFAKQDCWFSQEIEIYKGYNLIEKVGDGKDILSDFNTNDSKSIYVERSFRVIE